MNPRLVVGIVLGLLLGSLPILWVCGLPLLWAPVISIGGIFCCAAWVGARIYYPGQPRMWVISFGITLVPTLVALWVVRDAGQMAGNLSVRRKDSELRTEISAMMRDKPEEYPPLGEGLRRERVGRLLEVLADGSISPRTLEFAQKTLTYLEERLPQEIGFRYRVNTEGRLRDSVAVLEATPTQKLGEPGPVLPAEEPLVAVEDRAALRPLSGARHALADLWAMRGVSLRAACTLAEARWLVLFTWEKPVLKEGKYRYPCVVSLSRRDGEKWLPAGSASLASFAEDAEADADADTAEARGFNQGDQPRHDSIRKWLEGPGK